jgi:ATP-dependent Zn protease
MAPVISEDKKVSDMTAKELKELIKDTVYELTDADYGLTVRDDVEEELKESLLSTERIPVERIAEALALKW